MLDTVKTTGMNDQQLYHVKYVLFPLLDELRKRIDARKASQQKEKPCTADRR